MRAGACNQIIFNDLLDVVAHVAYNFTYIDPIIIKLPLLNSILCTCMQYRLIILKICLPSDTMNVSN